MTAHTKATDVLVTGGTGTLGSAVARRLVADGVRVRVLSRGRRAPGSANHYLGDLTTGAGLDAALDGVDAVVHCADPLGHLLGAARRTGVRHIVYTSIVGIDAIPMGLYRRKLDEERRLAASGIGWTVQRATQFHDLIAMMLRLAAIPPLVMPVPAGWSFQPVDVRDVADRLAALTQGEPTGRAPDLGGPQVLPIEDLARIYLRVHSLRRRLVPISAPGRAVAAYRRGANLTPAHADGTVTFEQFLREEVANGERPYRGAIRSYLPSYPSLRPGSGSH